MRLLFTEFALPNLINDSQYPVGGWAVELSAWLKGLNEIGHRSGLLAWKGANELAGRASNFDLIETYDPKCGIKVLKYVYSYVPSMLAAARNYRPDALIQACAGVDTGIMAFIARRLGVPFLYRAANDSDADGRYRRNLKTYQQIAYRYGIRQASAILCQNKYQMERYRLAFPDKSLHCIHNPFEYPADMPGLRSRARRSYVAWIGNFKRQKNLPLLCRVAEQLPSLKFRVAGAPLTETMDDETHAALRRLHELENVEMAGYVRHGAVLEFLSGAVALLSTADHEGFSNTFLEACAVGTPIVLRRQVDPDGFVAENALGFAGENEGDLCRSLRDIQTMETAEFEQLSRRCADRIANHHLPAAKARELIAVVESRLDR